MTRPPSEVFGIRRWLDLSRHRSARICQSEERFTASKASQKSTHICWNLFGCPRTQHKMKIWSIHSRILVHFVAVNFFSRNVANTVSVLSLRLKSQSQIERLSFLCLGKRINGLHSKRQRSLSQTEWNSSRRDPKRISRHALKIVPGMPSSPAGFLKPSKLIISGSPSRIGAAQSIS